MFTIVFTIGRYTLRRDFVLETMPSCHVSGQTKLVAKIPERGREGEKEEENDCGQSDSLLLSEGKLPN